MAMWIQNSKTVNLDSHYNASKSSFWLDPYAINNHLNQQQERAAAGHMHEDNQIVAACLTPQAARNPWKLSGTNKINPLLIPYSRLNGKCREFEVGFTRRRRMDTCWGNSPTIHLDLHSLFFYLSLFNFLLSASTILSNYMRRLTHMHTIRNTLDCLTADIFIRTVHPDELPLVELKAHAWYHEIL
jgi:hypothetical protein